jgi:NAD(P)-dependent dehydrogenase (short-subunit alcohol dehydrogenase family)
MLASGATGAFVNVVELPAAGAAEAAPYAAAAEGMVALTRVLAVEWAPAGIRVCSVVTEDVESEAEELAASIGFLAGPGASYITGQELRLGGAVAT